MGYDRLIEGGRIYDGSGLPSYLGDVAITNGRIAGIGRISDSAKHIVKADGLAVAPGFIDFHTHLDAQRRRKAVLQRGRCGRQAVNVITSRIAPAVYITSRPLARVKATGR